MRSKHRLAVSVIGRGGRIAVAVLAFALSVSEALAQTAVSLDPNLENALHESGAPSPITQEYLATVTSVTWWATTWPNVPDASRRIHSLDGLEYADNLRSLDLRENAVSQLNPLAGLSQLQRLVLVGGSVSDLSPLSNLDQLQVLGITGNSVSDVSPLSALTSLDTLGLARNSITDISPLAALTNLICLELGGNDLSGISAIRQMRSLEALALDGTGISDITDVSGLQALTVLSLENNQISDISPLSGLRNLRRLDLIGNPLDRDAYDIYIPMIEANNPGVLIDYDPLPEPASLLLLGVAGLGICKRRQA